jgi:DedD protein
MRKQGFPAFLEPIQAGGQELLRVRVGPEVDRARAEDMAANIEKKIRLKGQVVRYP